MSPKLNSIGVPRFFPPATNGFSLSSSLPFHRNRCTFSWFDRIMADAQVVDRLSPPLRFMAANAGGRRRASLSAEVVAGLVKAVDFCLVLGAAVTAFVFYFGFTGAT